MHGAMSEPETLVGIVGYTPVLECYPLGPRLMGALEREVGTLPGTRVENLTWSPIHVVQQFQDVGAWAPARIVLVGAAALCERPGRVRAFRWDGGTLPESVVQARVYEAVTGIVDIENTLMIGEHFGVWPAEVYSVEADLQADAFGRMVIADSDGWGDERSLELHLGFSPARVTAELARLAGGLARCGGAGDVELHAKSATLLAPVAPFARNRTVGGRGARAETAS